MEAFSVGRWGLPDGGDGRLVGGHPVGDLHASAVSLAAWGDEVTKEDASDLLEAAKAVIAQFEFIKQVQNKVLVEGQILESASRNWESLGNEYIDFQPLIDAVAKAEATKR